MKLLWLLFVGVVASKDAARVARLPADSRDRTLESLGDSLDLSEGAVARGLAAIRRKLRSLGKRGRAKKVLLVLESSEDGFMSRAEGPARRISAFEGVKRVSPDSLGVTIVEVESSEVAEKLWRAEQSILLMEADDELTYRVCEGASCAVQSTPENILERGTRQTGTDITGDTYSGLQWGLKDSDGDRHDIRYLEGSALVDAWAGGAAPVLAMLDSGCDVAHPDLAARLWVNPGEIANNGIDDDGNGFVDDVHGWDFANRRPIVKDASTHGTHCAGIAAAERGNSWGIAGVLPGPARLMPLASGTSIADAVEALRYAVAMGARVSSNSWGFNSDILAMRVAIEAAARAGHLFVVAVDNRGRDNASFQDFPPNWGIDARTGAGLPSLLRVANHDRTGRLASSSNYGVHLVDVSAPGTDILSTVPVTSQATLSYKTGTSMATPHVAAAAAVARAILPDMTPGETRDLIMETARKTPELQGKLISGAALDYEALILECLRRANIDTGISTTTTAPPSTTTTTTQTVAPTASTTARPTTTTTTTRKPRKGLFGNLLGGGFFN